MRKLAPRQITIILFLASTLFFLYQHAINTSWDFTVYVSNAKYWAGQSALFEAIRPPVMPFAILLLGIFGWKTAEYLYIIAASLLFAYSSIAFARAFKVNENVFYLFSLTPLVLFYGLINGAELPSLAFLELSVVFSLRKSWLAGIFLALACLSRYNLLAFVPLLVLQRNVKTIFQSILAFFIMFVPWFAYNFWEYGNFFTSIADSYAMNFLYRSYLIQPVRYEHFVMAAAWLLPLVVWGICLLLRQWKSVLGKGNLLSFAKREWASLMIVAIIILTAYQYAQTPVKSARYLISLAAPIAYFSAISFKKLQEKRPHLAKAAIFAFILFNVVWLGNQDTSNVYQTDSGYRTAISALENLSIVDCRTMSNVWPVLHYFGKNAEPAPRRELVNKTLADGDFFLLFYSAGEPDWAMNRTFLRTLPVLAETNTFAVIGNKTRCNPERPVDRTYLSLTQEHYLLVHNATLNINPCFILFQKNSIVERSCNFINGNGFVRDENRALP